MTSANERSAELFAAARRVIPGGVNSPVRSFAAVGGDPFFVAAGDGAYLVDVDGQRYLDYVQSWGASILGHADPEVIDAIAVAIRRGTTFGAPVENEVRLAEELVAASPGCEMVRLVSSGTEAAMTAIRLARGFTGRDRIVKFAGCYHGHSDALLAAGGSGVATLGLTDSAGVPRGAVADTVVAPYNVVPELGPDVAAVIVEPVAANMGLVAPEPGFLEGLRSACDASGALLVFDEVITGFRLGRGGASGRFGITPDLVCLGKIIGGGLPLAAVGGRGQVMERLAPLGDVYQAGTLSGNPVATAAGLAVLGRCTPDRYEALERRVAALTAGLERAFAEARVGAQVPRLGTLFSVFFSDEPVRDYDGARRAAGNGRYAEFFRQMRRCGVALAPSPYEVAFTSFAHGDDEIERTIALAADAAAVIAAR